MTIAPPTIYIWSRDLTPTRPPLPDGSTHSAPQSLSSPLFAGFRALCEVELTEITDNEAYSSFIADAGVVEQVRDHS